MRITSLILVLFSSAVLAAEPVTFTAMGDQPYGPLEPFEKLIQKINQDKNNQFTIHVGDIKSGSTLCSTEYFIQIKQLFNTFSQPLIYTPGDNEWTDCHRQNNGTYEPQERLAKLRELFFATPQSLGQKKIQLQSQAQTKGFEKFVENTRWTRQDILFVNVHVVGSNNNMDPNVPGALEEFAARNKANMHWLSDSYQLAKQKKIKALVISMQADPFDFYVPKESGFTEFLKLFTSLAQDLPIPTLMIQGDSHKYVLDQPFKDSQGQTLSHVQRLVVPGASLTEAVRIQIQTNEKDAKGAFQFKRVGLER